METSEEFDPVKHGFDNMIGKTIDINGTIYIINNIIAIGGEKIVVSLRNQKTSVIKLVARIFKFKKGSKLYELYKKNVKKSGHMHYFKSEKSAPTSVNPNKKDTIRLELIDVASGPDFTMSNIIVMEGNNSSIFDYPMEMIDNYEFYEINGALLQIQSIWGDSYDVNTELDNLLAKCEDHLNNGEFNQLEKQVYEVLKLSPNHTDAILIYGISLIRQKTFSNLSIGIDILKSVIALENNYDLYYEIIIEEFCKVGKTEEALKLIDYKLNLYNENIKFIYLKFLVITKFDYIERFQNLTASYEKIIELNFQGYIVELYTKSLRRFIDFRAEFDDGIELMKAKNYSSAIVKLNKAIEISKRPVLASVNLCISYYYSANYKMALELVLQEIFCNNQPNIKDSLLLVLALSYFEIGLYEYSLNALKDIEYVNSLKDDMPAFPSVFILTDNGVVIEANQDLSIIKNYLKNINQYYFHTQDCVKRLIDYYDKIN